MLLLASVPSEAVPAHLSLQWCFCCVSGAWCWTTFGRVVRTSPSTVSLGSQWARPWAPGGAAVLSVPGLCWYRLGQGAAWLACPKERECPVVCTALQHVWNVAPLWLPQPFCAGQDLPPPLSAERGRWGSGLADVPLAHSCCSNHHSWLFNYCE